MPIDISNLFHQIESASPQIEAKQLDFAERLARALKEASLADTKNLNTKLNRYTKEYKWLAPNIGEGFSHAQQPAKPPKDFIVLAVDGSQIEASRDDPQDCFLINTGQVFIKYGKQPRAEFNNKPLLFFGDDQTTITDKNEVGVEHDIDSSIISALRDTAEINSMAELALKLPGDIPAFGLIDGSLSQWKVTSSNQRIQESLMEDYNLAVQRLKKIAQAKNLSIASYISSPATKESINALRIGICPFPTPDCNKHCVGQPMLSRPCDVIARVRDRDLFTKLLDPGQRSGLFNSKNSITSSKNSELISYFYIKTKTEIARIEIPEWSSANIDKIHSVIFDQIGLGHGYPISLQEAHEQAVVRSSDRKSFWRVIESKISDSRLPSQKNVSKSRRGI